MTFRTVALEVALTSGRRRALDFLELSKPRLVLMILVTTYVGFYLGSEQVPDYLRLLQTLMGTALTAGGTLALNELLERDTDSLMERTRRRPLPEGRVQPLEALIFGLLSTVTGLMLLVWGVNVLSALVTALIVGTYLFLYTPLKLRTPFCGVVGAVPGALPPLIGWAAARGELGVEAWVLFAILFFWQIPHTLAIARLYRDDFARAGIRFLPVVDPEGRSTGRQAVGFSLALLGVSLLPMLLGLAGMFYFMVALLIGFAFLAVAYRLAVSRSVEAARQLLFVSLIYLPVLLLVMALDRTVS